MTPDERALAMLGLWVDEGEATEGARISHGEIRKRFAARAARCHDELERLWEDVERIGDVRQLAGSLLDMAGRLVDQLAAVDPAHRPPHEVLAELAAGSWATGAAGTSAASGAGGSPASGAGDLSTH